MLYKLKYDDYKGETSDIDLIIDDINEKILTPKGLTLCTFVNCYDKILMDKKIEVIHEEVLQKNMTSSEKKEKVKKYLKDICVEEKELLITDPYIFSVYTDEDKAFLIDLLKSCKSNLIKIITKERSSDSDFIRECQNVFGDRLQVYYSEDFHDRFWLSGNDKGFLIGTSLNGIGKKYCIIKELDKDEVEVIYDVASAIITKN